MKNIRQTKIGSSIKVFDRVGKEKFFKVEVMRGEIALFNPSGTLACTRVRSDEDTFFLYGETFHIVSDIPNLNTLNIKDL